MVSKVAVIALVAIFACPILLGYAMNLTEVTSTDYKKSGNEVNVTETLWNSISYSYSHADTFPLNTNTAWPSNTSSIPIYNTIGSTTSSYNLKEDFYNNQTGTRTETTDYAYFYGQIDYNPASNSAQMDIYGMVGGTEQIVRTVNYAQSFYYSNITQEYSCTFFSLPDPMYISFATGTGEITKIVVTMQSGSSNMYFARNSTSASYVDFIGGFYFSGYYYNYIKMPEYTKSVLMTINLDSITNANYSTVLIFADTGYRLDKTTTNGVVSWKATQMTDPTKTVNLYYDQTRSDNTYQIYDEYMTVSKDSSNYYYTSNVQFRYVGGWPQSFGEANTYLVFNDTINTQSSINNPEHYLDFIGFYDQTNLYRTPTIRIDDALFRAFEYPTFEDKTYTPSDFRENPSTTIGSPTLYGSSIEFGGHTYTVSKGNITLDGKQIPIKDLKLSSVLINGSYENRIGNTVVSITADPSTIVFNGKWSANITTDSMEQTTITSTRWVAGEFAWDGIDSNFLMVGLLTSLGIFIALGVYSRRSKASVWPLMLVTGGAALMFFIMI